MRCSCDVSPVVFAIPGDLRTYAPGGDEIAAICPRCLALAPAPVDGEPGEPDPAREPDFARVSDAFPDGEGGVALALALGLLESLATNRRGIEACLERAERAGADPLLTIDRLLADPSVDPAIDLERRRPQLESLL